MEDYTLETAKRVCGDVAGLLQWTRAMSSFFSVNKEVLPLKANLVVQEAKYNVAMSDLSKAQGQLDDKQRELDLVQAQYDAAMAEKQVKTIIPLKTRDSCLKTIKWLRIWVSRCFNILQFCS